MVLTLRAFNSKQQEIGWLTVDPYEWEIGYSKEDHEDTHRAVKIAFDTGEDPQEKEAVEVLQDSDELTSSGGMAISDPEFKDNREHIEYIKQRIVDSYYFEGAVEISDE